VPGRRVELPCSGQAQRDCLDPVHDILEELWQLQPGVAEIDRIMFSTAVLEICSNILAHGAAASLSVTVGGDNYQLEAELTDDGSAADVDLDAAVLPKDLAESGRGLAMVRMAVDEVSHEYADGLNHWHLRRRR